mmetsp:Transcript_14053/g.15389  ORF Transcript_14053/g.15389 Transcript_14053/m.15389 type:complete len:128 (+) Transcript_14053:554-937(+)
MITITITMSMSMEKPIPIPMQTMIPIVVQLIPTMMSAPFYYSDLSMNTMAIMLMLEVVPVRSFDGTYSVSFQSFDDDGNDEGANPFDSNNTDGADSFNGDVAEPLKGSNNNGADSFDSTDDTTVDQI